MKHCAICNHSEAQHNEDGCLCFSVNTGRWCKCEAFISALDAMLAEQAMATMPGVM